MSAQHTPGPWEIDTTKNDGEYGNNGPDTRSGFMSYVVMDANGRALFDSVNSDAIEVEEDGEGYAWDAVGEANLRLAAAAPELLDALKHAVYWFDQLTKADADRYKAAIAKASASPKKKSGAPLGVTPNKRAGKWQASIQVDGKSHFLGLHASAESAHAAYVQAKRAMHEGNTL